MREKDQIIRTIELAYHKPYADHFISKEEIQNYIRSFHFLQDILHFTSTAFFVIDCKAWQYLYCSTNVQEVLGGDAEEFIQGGPVFGLTRLVPEDLEVPASIHTW